MASTNKTTNLELSQYVSSDKPTYLVDYNSDMAKIDTGVHTAQVSADTASTAATNAQTTAETAQTTANTAVTNAATADGKGTQALSNIGTLANLNTVAKTNLVDAINEVDSKVKNAYNTSSGDTYSCDYINNALAAKEDLPVTLYENTNGSLTDITLTDNAHKYTKFEFYGVDKDDTSRVMFAEGVFADSSTIELKGIDITSTIASLWDRKYTVTNNTTLTYVTTNFWSSSSGVFVYNNFIVKKIVAYE